MQGNNKVTSSSFFYSPEAPFQQTSVNRCPGQTGNLMQTPEVEESTWKCLSQMGNTTRSHPSLVRALPLWTNDVHCATQRPELRSPSSFMPQMKAGAEVVSVEGKTSVLTGLLSTCMLLIAGFPCGSAGVAIWLLSYSFLVLAVILTADQINWL